MRCRRTPPVRHEPVLDASGNVGFVCRWAADSEQDVKGRGTQAADLHRPRPTYGALLLASTLY
jgi:hypothetical protein